jgi:hypothetical protein
VSTGSALWPSPWPGEDAGPARLGTPLDSGGDAGKIFSDPSAPLRATSREALVATMVVTRDPGEVYLLRHTGPPDATCFVEQIDPVTLEPLRRSPDLLGGPVWPGGLAAHEDGCLYVIFGNHAHRLNSDLEVEAIQRLPRERPYNSFVVLPDGQLVTKDFAGPFAGHVEGDHRSSELLALNPDDLSIAHRFELSEPSVARLSSDGHRVVVVGTHSLFSLTLDEEGFQQRSAVRYRSEPGQGCGWDGVVDGDVVYFMDNGDGTDRFDGSFEGRGIATVPLRLHRIDLAASTHDSVEVSGLGGGIIANPPALDRQRQVVVAFDSGNATVAGFSSTTLVPLWKITLNHAAHIAHDEVNGYLVLSDFHRGTGVDHAVIIDTLTGRELNRVATHSPLQSVLFPAKGFSDDLYLVSFTTVTRLFA